MVATFLTLIKGAGLNFSVAFKPARGHGKRKAHVAVNRKMRARIDSDLETEHDMRQVSFFDTLSD